MRLYLWHLYLLNARHKPNIHHYPELMDSGLVAAFTDEDAVEEVRKQICNILPAGPRSVLLFRVWAIPHPDGIDAEGPATLRSVPYVDDDFWHETDWVVED